MTTEVGSTLPRRQLGRYLRQLRDDAGITIKTVSQTLHWSAPKIWRIESGIISVRPQDVAAMCRLYRAPAEMTEALMGLARETRAKGWWHSYGDAIPEWFELYVGLEASTSHLRKYEAQLIPGLLQTKAYASEVYRIGQPAASHAERDRGVAVRLGRQAILTRIGPPPPQLDVVLDEGALRRPLADSAAMATQLSQLNTVGEQPNVSIRVLPFRAGLHRAELANGAFTILDFPTVRGRQIEPSMVYSDGLTGALYLEKPAEVTSYQEVWDSLRTSCLDEQQSRILIASIAEEYSSP
jgi:transcriptional regulator with XRE-family HTH domain